MRGQDARRLHRAIGLAIRELERPFDRTLTRTASKMRSGLIEHLREAEGGMAKTMSRLGECPERDSGGHVYTPASGLGQYCEYCGIALLKLYAATEDLP